jgi:hypothetical protein
MSELCICIAGHIYIRYIRWCSNCLLEPILIVMYSPFVQFFIVYLATYRHEVGRFLRPFREHASIDDWRNVLKSLGVEAILPEKGPECGSDKRLILTFGITVILSASITLMMVFVLQKTPSLPPLFRVALSILSQFIPATYFLAFISKWYLGPLPNPPKRMLLRYPRLGSRIRHLMEDD